MKLLTNMLIKVFIFFNVVGFLLVFVASGGSEYGLVCAKNLESPAKFARSTSETRIVQLARTAYLSSIYLGTYAALYLMEKPGKCD